MLAYEFDKTDTGQLIDPDLPLLFGDKMLDSGYPDHDRYHQSPGIGQLVDQRGGTSGPPAVTMIAS